MYSREVGQAIACTTHFKDICLKKKIIYLLKWQANILLQNHFYKEYTVFMYKDYLQSFKDKYK